MLDWVGADHETIGFWYSSAPWRRHSLNNTYVCKWQICLKSDCRSDIEFQPRRSHLFLPLQSLFMAQIELATKKFCTENSGI